MRQDCDDARRSKCDIIAILTINDPARNFAGGEPRLMVTNGLKRFSPAQWLRNNQWYAVPLIAFLIAEVVNRFVLNNKMAIYFTYYQFLDPVALKTDFLRSLMLLHGQPPLLNVVAGLILKAAAAIGCSPEAIADLSFGVLSLAAALLLFRLTLRGTGSRIFASAAVILFFAEPSYYGGSNAGVGRNNFFYEFMLQSVILVACSSAASWLRSADYRAGLVFVLAAAAVVPTRTLFHPLLWGVPVAVAVLLPKFRQYPKRSLLLAACAFCLSGAWAMKNYFLFGIMTSSSWDGYNLCRDLAPLPKDLADINMNGPFPPATDLVGRFPRIAHWPSASLLVVT